MKENRIEDRINKAYCFLNSMHSDFRTGLYYKEDLENLEHILSDYKKLQEEFKQVDHECERLEEKEVRLIKENEELNKNYNSLIDKIILKIDEYDYKFEKAKKQNKNDIADYYWDLIINFKKLLGGE